MVDKCVACGEVIPEGRQICPRCEKALKNYKPVGVKTKKIPKFISDDKFIQLTFDDVEVK